MRPVQREKAHPLLMGIERFHPPSTLLRSEDGSLEVQLDPEPAYPVPWVSSRSFLQTTHPLQVTVHDGESLYLPAGWWHQVEQSEGAGRIAVAVN